jgi:malonate-semialdehyde dehydrogenase (acetylating)/methylmalonate-semialdehyde dehydrogenase
MSGIEIGSALGCGQSCYPKTFGQSSYVNEGRSAGSAINAAKEAFPEWRRTTPLARVRCLFRLKELMEKNFEPLSRVQTMEHGKTIDESRGETRRGIEMVEVGTGIPSLMMGYNLEDIATGIDEYVIYQPLGVFANLAPFNFPFMVPLWYSPFALATGNTFIVKPSPRDPISQTRESIPIFSMRVQFLRRKEGEKVKHLGGDGFF